MASDTPTPEHIAKVYMNTLSLKSDPASWWAHTEIQRLRADLAAAIKERDAARLEICDRIATPRWNPYIPIATARRYAQERGWDCFKEGGGA